MKFEIENVNKGHTKKKMFYCRYLNLSILSVLHRYDVAESFDIINRYVQINQASQ